MYSPGPNPSPLKRRLFRWFALGSGMLWRFERSMRQSLTVLTYHRVLQDGGRGQPLPWLCVSVPSFRRQMERLARTCRVLPLPQAVAEFEAGPAQRPLVAVTFDDGYLDNHEIAAPILEEHGARGTFFVTTGLIARQELPWWDRFLLLLGNADDAARAQVIARVPAAAVAVARTTPLLDSLQSLKDAGHAVRAAALRALAELVRPRPATAALMTPDHLRDPLRLAPDFTRGEVQDDDAGRRHPVVPLPGAVPVVGG